jgi:flagellar hook-associated protein 3 FlgL
MRIPTFRQFNLHATLMAKELEQMGRYQQQQASGKKLLASSDNPSLAFQINSKEDFLNSLKSYEDNGAIAQSRAGLINSTIQSTANVNTGIQSLIKQAMSGTLSDKDRATLANKLQGDLGNLMQLANTKDSNGEFIYGGSNASMPPYQLVNGAYAYQGSSNPMEINIGPNATATYGEAGDQVFGNFFDGNGRYTISANSANQGSAALLSNSVDSANYIPDNYTINYFTNTDGKLAYTVTGANTGQVIPSGVQAAPLFVPGQAIVFNGISMNVDGVPAAGDSFEVKPATQQNLFNVVSSLVDLLRKPVTNMASFNQAINQADQAFSQAANKVLNYQSLSGTRNVLIDAQIETNKKMITDQTIAISNLADVDFYEVSTNLSTQSIILQVTQESYMKMQSIFEKILQI